MAWTEHIYYNWQTWKYFSLGYWCLCREICSFRHVSFVAKNVKFLWPGKLEGWIGGVDVGRVHGEDRNSCLGQFPSETLNLSTCFDEKYNFVFRFVLRKRFAIVQLWWRLISPEEQRQHSLVEVPTLRQALPRLMSVHVLNFLTAQIQERNSSVPNLSSTSRGHSNNLASTKQRFCLFTRRGGATHQVGDATQPRNLDQILQMTLYQSMRSVIPTSKRVLSTMLWISLPDLRYTSATR